MQLHPVRLLIGDDLRRSRVTVLLRLLLLLPHLLWIGLWSPVVLVAVVVAWLGTLLRGRAPSGLHAFLAAYTRYRAQVRAYALLAADPYPGFFLGSTGPYPVDVDIDHPGPQSRLATLLRPGLLLPALLVSAALALSALGAAFLAWFAALVRGEAPRGLRDLAAWAVGYGAQARAYRFLLTDRYPASGPLAFLAGLDPPPVDGRPRLVNGDDLRRSRLTVLFRLPLAAPHLVWWTGWYLLAVLAWLANWLSALALGRSPRPLARFLAAFVRYTVHLSAFLFLVANPFPGFLGREGSYPVDARLDPFGRQRRLVTVGRIPFFYGLAPLVLPALLLWNALSNLLSVSAVLGWLSSLARGRMPAGLQEAGAYALGYYAQTLAYWWLLTDRHPHASPLAVLAPPPGAETEALD